MFFLSFFPQVCTCAHEKNKAQKVFFAMYFTCILASISSFCLPTFSQFLFYFPRENLSETHALHMCNYPFRSLTFMFFHHRSRLYIEGWVGDFFPQMHISTSSHSKAKSPCSFYFAHVQKGVFPWWEIIFSFILNLEKYKNCTFVPWKNKAKFGKILHLYPIFLTSK